MQTADLLPWIRSSKPRHHCPASGLPGALTTPRTLASLDHLQRSRLHKEPLAPSPLKPRRRPRPQGRTPRTPPANPPNQPHPPSQRNPPIPPRRFRHHRSSHHRSSHHRPRHHHPNRQQPRYPPRPSRERPPAATLIRRTVPSPSSLTATRRRSSRCSMPSTATARRLAWLR